jgi:alginate O-acetyltransferase complex protein AlgI
MIFHSLTYLVFLALVLGLYWSLPRRGQNIMLIFASYIFYGWEHPWFLLPLWASTLVDYSCALAMERFPRRRRAFLILSIMASIALLATFKYYGFALENINAILTNFGEEPLRNALRLTLPAGL